MTIALIARADDGGLGVQTWEIARHLRPDKVLVVNVASARGHFRPERYDGFQVRVSENPPQGGDLRWMLDMDAILTVEGCYNERLIGMASENGVKLFIYANPELYPRGYRDFALHGQIRTLTPTTWETHRLGPHLHLPMPVARDRIPYRRREGHARTVLHVSAPAFHDRNGTELVRESLHAYTGPPFTLLVAGPGRPTEPAHVGDVMLRPLDHQDDYWTLYDDADVLLVPRRYGGLSLVMQEAFAAGMPVISLDRDPENTWPTHRVTTTGHEPVRMKGGEFPVYTTNPQWIADALEHVVTTDNGDASDEADDYAETLAWTALLPAWQAALTVGVRA